MTAQTEFRATEGKGAAAVVLAETPALRYANGGPGCTFIDVEMTNCGGTSLFDAADGIAHVRLDVVKPDGTVRRGWTYRVRRSTSTEVPGAGFDEGDRLRAVLANPDGVENPRLVSARFTLPGKNTQGEE